MGELTIDLEIVKIKIGDEIYPEQLRKIKNPPNDKITSAPMYKRFITTKETLLINKLNEIYKK